MNRAVLAATAITAAGLVGFWVAPHLRPQPTAVPPQQQVPASAAAAQIPTLPAGVPVATSQPSESLWDSDRGPEPAAPATRPTAWATTPAPLPSAPPPTRLATTGTPRGATTDTVDTRNVDKVAEAFVTSAYTLDTRIDTNPQAGFARAAGWATADYRQYLVTAPAGSAGAEWNDLAARQGWTTVTVAPVTVADKPADTAQATIRSFRVTVTRRGESGVLGTQERIVFVVCTSTSSGWRVREFRQLD